MTPDPTRSQLPLRLAIGALGVGVGLWGLWLLRDDGTESLVSTVIWLAGGVVLHDAVLAPLTVGIGVVVTRVLPRRARVPVGVALAAWAAATLTFVAVLSGQGVKPDNPTLLPRDYWTAWWVLTAIGVALTVAAGLLFTHRDREDP